MKIMLKIITVFSLLLSMSSCDDDDAVVSEPTLDVNYYNVAGCWELVEWSGDVLSADSRYYYINLELSEEDGYYDYEIYTNINSFVSKHITGTYQIAENDDLESIISGTFDYTLTDDSSWAHEYSITELYDSSMKWTATDLPSEVRIYNRCDQIPEDIVDGHSL